MNTADILRGSKDVYNRPSHEHGLRDLLHRSRPVVLALVLVLCGWALARAELSTVQYWWVTMVLVGAIPVGLTIGGPWFRTAVAGSVLFVGASAQLAMTRPVWFQSVEIQPASRFGQLLLGAVAVQAAVTLGLLAGRGSLRSGLNLLRHFGAFRLLISIALVVVFITPLMDKIDRPGPFFTQAFLSALLFLLNMAGALAIARSLPIRHIEDSEATWTRHVLPRLRRVFVPFVALWVLLETGCLAFFAFERVPHVPDEVAYLFHAKTFLLGKLSIPAPSPEILASVNYPLLHAFEGQWFSIFPPGWPAVLSMGVWLDIAWLVNPILAAASIFLAHRFIRMFAEEKVANIAIVFMAVSPWFLGASASLMSHTFTQATVLSSWVALIYALTKKRVLLAFLSGLLMGLAFNARPLDGLLIGLLTGLWCLFAQGRRPWKIFLGYGIGCVASGILLLVYQQALLGDPFTTPINNFFNELWHEGANRIGFGSNVGPPRVWDTVDLYPGHSPKEALIAAHQNFHALNIEFLGWCTGSLLLAIVHLVWGRKNRADFYMAGIVTVVACTYSLYWYSGTFYIGPRYWFIVFIPLIYLTARGVTTLYDKLRSAPGVSFPAVRIGVALAVLCLFSMLSFTSWRGVAKYHGFRNFHDDYRVMLKTTDLTNGLIFVQDTTAGDFGSAYIFNSLRFEDRSPLFVRDLGVAANQAVVREFPDKSIYFAVGHSADARAHLVAGPLTAADLQ